MTTRRLITFFALVLLTSSSTASAQFLTPPNPWVPPAGIPEPSFGVRQQPPARPSAWPNAAAAGFYYVDRTANAATDSDNPNGYPARPRLTIPTSLSGPAYVEVRGNGYSVGSSLRLALNGSASNPVWIVGIGLPTFSGQEAEVQLQGQYFVVQGLRFVNTKIVFGSYSGSGASHAVLRQSEITGSTSDSGAMISMSSGSENVVIFNNLIHDNGPLSSSGEADLHGLKISSDTAAHHVWYIDNHSYRNSGDSVQLGSASPDSSNWSHTMFIGRNLMHEDRENACDLKAVRNIVISENEMYGYRSSSSSSGEACAAHNGTENLWLINNEAHGSSRGLTTTGANGYFAIGNLIYDIHESGFSRTSLSQGHAIMTRATSNIVIVGNTIHNVDHGIGIDGSATAQIANNIIAGVSSSGHQIGWNNSSGFNGSTVKNNLLASPIRLTAGSSSYESLSDFENGGNKTGSRNADPRFVSPPSNYRLSSTSPALNAGYSASGGPHPVYAQFQSLFPGYPTIAVDFDGVRRPASGAQWDLGVFEGSSGTTTERPSPPTGLRIIS